MIKAIRLVAAVKAGYGTVTQLGLDWLPPPTTKRWIRLLWVTPSTTSLKTPFSPSEKRSVALPVLQP